MSTAVCTPSERDGERGAHRAAARSGERAAALFPARAGAWCQGVAGSSDRSVATVRRRLSTAFSAFS